MRWLFTAPGDNAFLVHPSVSSGRGDQAKAPDISGASDQSLSSRVTNERRGKDLSKSIFGRCFHFGLDWLAWRSSFRSCFDWRLSCDGCYPRLNYYHATVHALPEHPIGLGVMRDYSLACSLRSRYSRCVWTSLYLRITRSISPAPSRLESRYFQCNGLLATRRSKNSTIVCIEHSTA